MASGEGAKAVDPAALQNLLPASIAGWNRTSVENQGAGAAGLNGSNAQGAVPGRQTRASACRSPTWA